MNNEQRVKCYRTKWVGSGRSRRAREERAERMIREMIFILVHDNALGCSDPTKSGVATQCVTYVIGSFR